MPPPDLKKGPPPIPPGLVEWLEALFPDRFPMWGKDDVPDLLKLARERGRQDIISLLRDHVSRSSVQP